MAMHRETMAVVWIAPQVGPALAWLRELGAMTQMPGVVVREVCGPDVSRSQITLGLSKPADVVIWSGHGQQDERTGGYLLDVPRGRAVRGEWLATQVLRAAPIVFIGAACGSAVVDQHLESLIDPFSEAGINAVGFPAAADDEAAGAYVVEFVRALRAKRDVGRAHRVALEEAGGESLVTARGVVLKPAMTNGYRDIVDRMDGLDERLSRVEGLTRSIAKQVGVRA